MTIDQRLEKLTERHEALTQTVEIIAGMQREMESLVHIAGMHEHRPDDLEGN